MPGDPKECREHASRCAELATTAGTPELKAPLVELSRSWVKLAIELENAHALLDHNPLPPKEAGAGCLTRARRS